jgi:endonuclease/exonuclease/phosphatase family metal-dependent hydrolase
LSVALRPRPLFGLVATLWLALPSLAACSSESTAPVDGATDTVAGADSAVTPDGGPAEDSGPVAPKLYRVGAFNIEIFGTSKANDALLLAQIVEVVQRYDIVLLQELRDTSGEASAKLLAAVQQAAQGVSIDLLLSEPLGRSSNTERYGWLYRADRFLTLGPPEVLPDPDDLFEREPYAAHFRRIDGTFDFLAVGLHTKPGDVPAELAALATAVDDALAARGETDAVVLGDLNADCGFANAAEREASGLFEAPYTSWIPDEADTTVSDTDCAYDRILTRGGMTERVSPGTARVWELQSGLGISDGAAAAISDHHPVEIVFALE